MLFLGGALRKCCLSSTRPMIQIDALEHSSILFAASEVSISPLRDLMDLW